MLLYCIRWCIHWDYSYILRLCGGLIFQIYFSHRVCYLYNIGITYIYSICPYWCTTSGVAYSIFSKFSKLEICFFFSLLLKLSVWITWWYSKSFVLHSVQWRVLMCASDNADLDYFSAYVCSAVLVTHLVKRFPIPGSTTTRGFHFRKHIFKIKSQPYQVTVLFRCVTTSSLYNESIPFFEIATHSVHTHIMIEYRYTIELTPRWIQLGQWIRLFLSSITIT